MSSVSDFARCQTDNLMLLVGSNPLPNYVAGKLLARPDTRLHLVVTREMLEAGIPKRLTALLNRDASDDSLHITVAPADPDEIYLKVSDRVARTAGSWALHYTGGKKSMSTHAYRAMQDTLAKRDATAVYSYLDADTLDMVFDRSGGDPGQALDAHLQVHMTLAELLELHGQPESTLAKVRWDKQAASGARGSLGSKPSHVPFQPEVCRALLKAYLDDLSAALMSQWRDAELGFAPRWLFQAVFENASDSPDETKVALRDALVMGCDADPLGEYSANKIRNIRKAEKVRRWSDTRIPDVVGLIGGKTIGQVTAAWQQQVGRVGEWLHGPWLEDYVLNAVIQLAPEHGINDFALGLESAIWGSTNPREETFESDVILMQGYRLFYISVTTDTNKWLCKGKVFEAYIRARQLGGDEAQAALVTFYPDPARLEREIREAHRTPVKVFGPQHLFDPDGRRDFTSHLAEWFQPPRKEKQ